MNNIHAVNYIRRKYYLESYKRGWVYWKSSKMSTCLKMVLLVMLG